jgi:hypothetical protein
MVLKEMYAGALLNPLALTPAAIAGVETKVNRRPLPTDQSPYQLSPLFREQAQQPA